MLVGKGPRQLNRLAAVPVQLRGVVGDLLPEMGDDHVAPRELGEFLVSPRPPDAAVIAEPEVHQLGADPSGGEVPDDPHDVDLPLGGDDLGVERIGLDAEGLERALGEGKDPPHVRLPPVEGLLGKGGQVYAPVLEDRFQLAVGEEDVDGPLGLLGLHLELPGYARAYVDDLHMVAQRLLQTAPHGDHVRHHPD